jgi:hypothetical protein
MLRGLRGSLARAYACCCKGRVEAKNPAPSWVPKGRAEPAAQPATLRIASGGSSCETRLIDPGDHVAGFRTPDEVRVLDHRARVEQREVIGRWVVWRRRPSLLCV